MSSGRVCVSVLVFNGAGHLQSCVESVLAQTYDGLDVIVTDNASTDGSAELVARLGGKRVTVRQNPANIGYAAAHNEIFRQTEAEFLLPLNPDVLLSAGFVEHMVAAMESDPGTGTVQGKLLLPQPPTAGGVGPALIDSTGLVLTQARRCLDRGHGAPDLGQFDASPWIFGATGAAPLYRHAMLDDVAICNEF